MFDGYLSPPLGRDQILLNGWFLTGDLASKDERGLIRLEGREKSMINVAGKKVFPEEIEQVLSEHPAVAACRVLGRTHTLMGEYVVAEVQVKVGVRAHAADLSAWCRTKLSVHKVPRVIEFVDEIRLTANGKIDRT
jgi:acyl-CoA synthetase (AMP-forming)/AMP-acid ligase II